MPGVEVSEAMSVGDEGVHGYPEHRVGPAPISPGP
jgi:hypothetical protein